MNFDGAGAGVTYFGRGRGMAGDGVAGDKILKIFPNQVENIYRCHPWYSTMFKGSPVRVSSW